MSDKPPTASQQTTDIIHYHLNGGDGFFYVVLGGFFGEGLDFGEGDGSDDVGECHCQ